MAERKSQQSLFTDAVKPITVIHSRCLGVEGSGFEELFSGFDSMKAITFSYGLGFIEDLSRFFGDMEIVVGSERTVGADLVEVAVHQQSQVRRISKRKELVERIEAGTATFYLNRGRSSHEKIYILEARDGRTRIVTGSANLSRRAFTGGQAEEILCFDNDDILYGEMIQRFRNIKTSATSSLLEPAMLSRFIEADGDAAAELEATPVMDSANRLGGAVYLVDAVEDREPGDIEFSFSVEGLSDAERAVVDALKAQHVKTGRVAGGRLVAAPEVKRLINTARKVQAEHAVHEASFPRFSYDPASGVARLNDRPYPVANEREWENDAARIFSFFSGYDSFVGDIETMKRQLFKVMSFMFCAPFMSNVRRAAKVAGYSKPLYPLYLVLYGDSNSGKTSFAKMVLKAMYGSRDIGEVPHEKWTKTGIMELNGLCSGMCLLLDDITEKRFRDNAEKIIKSDESILADRNAAGPVYVIATNQLPCMKPELAKRCVPIRTEARLDRSAGLKVEKRVNDAVKGITVAFFQEYLARMARNVESMLEMIAAGDPDYMPDLLGLSSSTLSRMFVAAGCAEGWNAVLSIDDFIGDYAVGRIARDRLIEAYAVDPSQFSILSDGRAVVYRPRGSERDARVNTFTKNIFSELPASLDASLSNNTIVFHDVSATEQFLGIRFERGLRRVVRDIAGMFGSGKGANYE